MELFIAMKDNVGIEPQDDMHLESGGCDYVAGPDRAYLYLCLTLPADLSGKPVGVQDTLALWRVDTAAAAQALAAGLGAPDPEPCSSTPFEVTWIRNGQIAVRRKKIGADRALWLLHALAAEDLLDYQTRVFGPQAVDDVAGVFV